MTKRFPLILSISIVFLCLSCKQEKTLQNFIDCDYETNFKHDKVLRDAKNYFEVNIGNHWKRELYVDDGQSRMYAADTTRDYSESFIIDITRFDGRIVLDSVFQNKLKKDIENENRSYIIKDNFLNYNTKKGYGVFYFEHKGANPTYFMEFYIAYPEHYYLLKAIILGNEKFEDNLCETMEVINSFKVLP